MADSPTRYPFRVEPQEVDFTLRATVPALGEQILNTAGVDAHRKGFGVDMLQTTARSWVLSRMAIEIDRRPEQYARYTIDTWISDFNRVLSTRNFTLNDDSGREFGRAVTQWALFDLERRAAIDLSGVGQAHADALVELSPPTERPRKVRAITPTRTSVHRVVYSDIDFNRHVNTMRYIEMMLDMLPLDMVAGDAAMRLDIHFLKECAYGQTLTVGCEEEPAGARFEIAADDGIPAVRAAVTYNLG